MPYECVVLGTTPPATDDVLSAPTPDDLLPSLLAVSPRGRAWASDEWEPENRSETVFARFLRGIAYGFADAYAKLTELALASTVSTTDVAYLATWETELGLPDPCVSPASSVGQRRKAARLRLLQGGASPAFFICLAGRYGIEIEIVDGILPFECGRSGCGESDGCLDDELSWYVIAAAPAADTFFECGAGECGLTPLGERPTRSDLECLLTKCKPAHTNLYFRYINPTADVVSAVSGADAQILFTADMTAPGSVTADLTTLE